MSLRTLSTLDTLAQYVLVTRIAAAALTFVALSDRVLSSVSLPFVFVVLVGVNYFALRHWPYAVNVLRVAHKTPHLPPPPGRLGGGLGGAAVRRLIVERERASEEIGLLREQAAVREERLRV